jgi:nucleotide-binding universal stress UspA family protein
MYRNILIATDDSPQTSNAASQAIEFAHTFDATLHALYVLDSKLARTDATRESYEQIGERTLNRIKAEAAEKDVSVTTTLEEGMPAQVILDYAETRGIDLIILGGKTKSVVERFLIGNTAEKVVRDAPMSVFIVRKEHEVV